MYMKYPHKLTQAGSATGYRELTLVDMCFRYHLNQASFVGILEITSC